MIDILQFKRFIVEPVLKGMNLYSQEMEDLLCGTCANESNGGHSLIEWNLTDESEAICKRDFSKIGIYGMTVKMHDDLWKNYLTSQPKLTNDLMQTCMFSKKPEAKIMIYNLYYATAMATIFYKRSTMQAEIPKSFEFQGEHYNLYWNQLNGKPNIEEYVKKYNKFVRPSKKDANTSS